MARGSMSGNSSSICSHKLVELDSFQIVITFSSDEELNVVEVKKTLVVSPPGNYSKLGLPLTKISFEIVTQKIRCDSSVLAHYQS
jgi:hypothetical protein